MKAWELGPQTGLDGLRCTERPIPLPQPGEALIRVHAAGLNHRDLLALRGTYGPLKPQTRIPLSDGIGTIEAIVGDSRRLAPGMRVIAPHFLDWREGPYSPAFLGADLGISHDGWLAEYVCLPTAALVPVPDGVSDASAALLPGMVFSQALARWFEERGARALALRAGGCMLVCCCYDMVGLLALSAAGSVCQISPPFCRGVIQRQGPQGRRGQRQRQRRAAAAAATSQRRPAGQGGAAVPRGGGAPAGALRLRFVRAGAAPAAPGEAKPCRLQAAVRASSWHACR